MRKSIFIMTLALAGCFGMASAQTGQTKTSPSSGTTIQKDTATLYKKGSVHDPSHSKKQTTKKSQSSSTSTHEMYEKQGTSTNQPGSTGTGSTTGTGSSVKTEQENYENRGTGTSGTGSQGTYQERQGTGTGTSQNEGTGTGSQGIYQQDRTKTQDTYGNQSMSQDDKGWTKIGEKTVNLSKDREEIAITGAEKFSSIKIKVTDPEMVDVENVVVEFEGGSKQTIAMDDMPINSTTGESKVIELDSSDRNIKKVSFDYKANDQMSGSKSSTSTSKGTQGSMGSERSSKGTQGTAQKSTTGTSTSQGSKAKVEVWGLKSDTALK